KLPRGRPPDTPEGRRLQRKARVIGPRVADLFEHRHLFVRHHLGAAERATLQRLGRYGRPLRALRGIMDIVVPLADVADIVWRTTRPTDESNHFADMDFVAEEGKYAGKDLLTLCQDDANVSAHVWNEFYANIGEDKKQGALPFRIWQMYD